MIDIYRLEFTREQLTVLNAALMELPAKYSLPLIEDINKQIAALESDGKD